MSVVPGTTPSSSRFSTPFRTSALLACHTVTLSLPFSSGHGFKSSCRRRCESTGLLSNVLLNPTRAGFCPGVYNTWTGERSTCSRKKFCRRSSLPLTETIAALQAFRKRYGDAQRIHAQYASQPTTVDFAHYRSVLRNTAIVNEAEKLLKDFKPVTYDVNAHIKAIETFEAKAVSCHGFASCISLDARYAVGRESHRDCTKN